MPDETQNAPTHDIAQGRVVFTPADEAVKASMDALDKQLDAINEKAKKTLDMSEALQAAEEGVARVGAALGKVLDDAAAAVARLKGDLEDAAKLAEKVGTAPARPASAPNVPDPMSDRGRLGRAMESTDWKEMVEAVKGIKADTGSLAVQRGGGA